MDALEFLRERKRMCNSYEHCKGCPLERGFCNFGPNAPEEVYERIIATVEQWSKEHPRKTRQSVFLEQWPDCLLDGDCVIGLCPRNVDKNYICDVNRSDGCPGCRRKFWGQEVE